MKLIHSAICTLALLLCCTLSANANPYGNRLLQANDNTTITANSTLDDVTYYVEGVRGFWFGYMGTLYNVANPSLSDDCLN